MADFNQFWAFWPRFGPHHHADVGALLLDGGHQVAQGLEGDAVGRGEGAADQQHHALPPPCCSFWGENGRFWVRGKIPQWGLGWFGVFLGS